MRTVLSIFISALLLGAANAAPQSSQKTIKVFIRQDCKWLYYGGIALEKGDAAALKEPSYVDWDPSNARPLVFRDERTSITFYVESDGRHVAAISQDGRLLWVRNPYEDIPYFCPYRTPRPVIARVETMELDETWRGVLKERGVDASHTFLRIEFDSSQMGLLDETNGNFVGGNQN
jgi:hypothetical protein